MNVTFKLTQGEVGKQMTVVLWRTNSRVKQKMDLTGKTVTLLARRGRGGAVVIDNEAMTINPDQVAAKGEATYTFTSGSANLSAGEYLMQFKVTDGGATVFVPNNPVDEFAVLEVVAALA